MRKINKFRCHRPPTDRRGNIMVYGSMLNTCKDQAANRTANLIKA